MSEINPIFQKIADNVAKFSGEFVPSDEYETIHTLKLNKSTTIKCRFINGDLEAITICTKSGCVQHSCVEYCADTEGVDVVTKAFHKHLREKADKIEKEVLEAFCKYEQLQSTKATGSFLTRYKHRK